MFAFEGIPDLATNIAVDEARNANTGVYTESLLVSIGDTAAVGSDVNARRIKLDKRVRKLSGGIGTDRL